MDLTTVAIALTLIVLAVAVPIFVLRRPRVNSDFTAAFVSRLEAIQHAQERCERALREDLSRVRDGAAAEAKLSREELTGQMKQFGDSVQNQMMQVTSLQSQNFDTFRQQLTIVRETMEQRLDAVKEANEKKLDEVKRAVDDRLKDIRDDSAKQLEQMRLTVDEKLQGTLEKRLGDSFKIVSERLEQVHQGLGQMKELASGVTDLSRVLSNVKSRGILGETMLAALLEEILTPDQYDRDIRTNLETRDTVEFAIKLPGSVDGQTVWLPIDSKFPTEDYQRLIDAHEAADGAAADQSAKALELRLKTCANDICKKYVNPPATTDFAIMFLPLEGLYAEAVRRAGLVEHVRRNCKVIIAGPSTLAALLNSLQMGFQTLAIQKRSSEVWKHLGIVKAEFAKFGNALDAISDKLHEASKKIDVARHRSRMLENKLKGVDSIAADSQQPLFLLSERLADVVVAED